MRRTPEMSCSSPSSADQPNPTPSPTTPTYEPVGIFWDYGQPSLASPSFPKLNPDRKLPALHKCFRVQPHRQHPQPGRPVRGSQPLQGIPSTPRQVFFKTVLPPIRTSVLWFVTHWSVHLAYTIPRSPPAPDCPHNGKNSVDLMMIGQPFHSGGNRTATLTLTQWISWRSSRTIQLRPQ
jgi:hypothetical protein